MAERFPIRLQVFGWTLLVGIYFAITHAAMPPEFPGSALYESITLGLVGAALSSVLWWIYRRLALAPIGPMAWTTAVVGSVVGSGFWYALLHTLDWLIAYDGFESPLELTPGQIAGDLMLYVFTLLAWHGALFAQRAAVRAAGAERLAQEARLLALRYQLNPHFLFNALNSAIAMIDEDPPRAQKMLTLLAGLLRQTLTTDATAASTLGEELDLVDRYVEIERVRFEDKLDVRLDVSDAARRCALPPLLLQGLVENAVKHGMRTSAMPLVVRVGARVERGVLEIEVSNSGKLGPPGDGLGLKNVAERLDSLYPGRHEFAVVEEGGAVRARLAIRAPEGAPPP